MWELTGDVEAFAGTPGDFLRASRSRLDAGMVRIVMVCTPGEFRGHRYAAAVTATAGRAALELGAADLAYPASNGVYQRIGYPPVPDRVVMEFSS
ncbi:hypothetical protein ODJ79_05660 [Actinoplanes sp. KI2]|uniref:GNAT family N-acetyltransferase n=1 Tax=Actinoplanes sp. KI2 TaxID=2983315 RepID=UPI0021D59897|nr:hypothetical protein [Actinoplanes sp. KI2]MCU7723194.1 hypothetical protein [Actinoplanes sp. KI2]